MARQSVFKLKIWTNRYDTQSSKSLKPKLNRAMINCFVSFLQIYNFEGKQNGIRTPTLSSSIFYNRRNFRQASSRKPFFLRDWKNDQSRGMPFALFNFADINCRRTLAANPRVFPCRMRTMAAGWIVRIVRETETGLIHRSESVARVLRLRPLKRSLSLLRGGKPDRSARRIGSCAGYWRYVVDQNNAIAAPPFVQPGGQVAVIVWRQSFWNWTRYD